MNQPELLPEENQEAVSLPTNDPALETFWQSFTVFLWPFERFCVRRWYILLLAYFLVAFVTSLVSDFAFDLQYHNVWLFFQDWYFSFDFFYNLNTSIHSLLITAMFLTVGLANHWQQKIPQVFSLLEQRCHLKGSEREEAYLVYLREYQRALRYGKRRIWKRPVVDSIWRGYSIVSIATSILSLLLLIVSYRAFFVPISAIRRNLLDQRTLYEDAIASRTAKLAERINEMLKEEDLSQLKATKEELGVVQALFPRTLGAPNWPFSRVTLWLFFLAIAGMIASLIAANIIFHSGIYYFTVTSVSVGTP
jgi:hypothetical protein